jgi:competence protein ComEA
MKGKLFSVYFLVAALLLAMSSTSFAADRNEAKSKEERAARVPAKDKINLNTADSETLQTLPGVGPSIAEAIIAARPFKNVNELKDVRGIGEERFKDIKPLVTARKSPENVGAAASTTRGVDKGPPRQLAEVAREVRSSERAREPRAVPSGPKININTATQEELESLPGIGPVKAQAIIDGRPYRRVDEVMNVKGIKEGIFEDIRDRITVR